MIAAIQAMGTYKYYSMKFDEWSDQICGDASRGEYWRAVFEQHPEFFRSYERQEEQYVSLVWRRQFPDHFHTRRMTAISPEDAARTA